MTPMMDAGEGEPTPETLWLSLTPDEAHEFRDGLNLWFDQRPDDPEWHFHVVDAFGRVITIDIMEPDDPRFRPK